jgi:hypothetical protein
LRKIQDWKEFIIEDDFVGTSLPDYGSWRQDSELNGNLQHWQIQSSTEKGELPLYKSLCKQLRSQDNNFGVGKNKSRIRSHFVRACIKGYTSYYAAWTYNDMSMYIAP